MALRYDGLDVGMVLLLHCFVNDTEFTQREKGLFTKGRWRKRPIAKILALNTHIKRHPGVDIEPLETPPIICSRSFFSFPWRNQLIKLIHFYLLMADGYGQAGWPLL